MRAAELPELGVGITWSSALDPLIQAEPSAADVIEIEPQTVWVETGNDARPYRVAEDVVEHLVALPGRKLVHSVGTPVGGSVMPDPGQIALLREAVLRLGSPWISDHLSFNSTEEFRTGFFLPPRQSEEGVDVVAASIRNLQASLPVPLAVETGVNYLRPRRDEMSDGAFVAAVAGEADCGLLLDLHNVFANALNGRQAIDDFVAELPLERVWELHVAGGVEMDGFWLDAHSGAIPEPLMESARRILPALPNVKAIVFEIFPAYIPAVGLGTIRGELEKLRELWALRGSGGGSAPRRPVPRTRSGGDFASPLAWERALGSLAVGRSAPGELARELEQDPGVRVLRHLIQEFRASMIVNVLRLTSRLLMLALGVEAFQTILREFWARTPPRLYAASEAREFARFLEELDLQVPGLTAVLAFERAVLTAVVEEKAEVVRFGLDPLPLLRALAAGRLPDVPRTPGEFEIEITPDGHGRASGVDRDQLQKVYPFH